MKTKIFIALFFGFLFVGFTLKVINDSDLRQMKLNGKVKSIKEISYKAKDDFGEIKKGVRARRDFWKEDYIIVFNNKGNKIEEKKYSTDGGLKEKIIYKYNGNTNKTEERYYKQNGSLDYKLSYKYEENILTEINRVDPNDKLVYKIKLKYDSNNNLQEKTRVSDKGRPIFKYIYYYNKKGYKIKAKAYNYYNNKKLYWIRTYDYNERGDLIEKKEYDENKELTSKTIFKYNDKGNIKKEYKPNDNQDHWSYSYKYDKNENWIRKTIYNNEIPQYIVERTIEYYN
jgi:hypothetical protein